MKQKKNLTRQFILILFLIISLPLIVVAVQYAIKLTGRAFGHKANFVIDYNSNLGEIVPVWKAIAQGGEEKGDMISSVVPQIRNLDIKYIRLDHLYDQYNLVSRDVNGKLNFNFTELDKAVDSIIASGAKPFFALSYMPPELSQSDIVDKPKNWGEWSTLIKATVEHYSGRGLGQKNISEVYYEVWNEPDLFGNWKMSGNKNYLDLYRATALGAKSATNVNSYKIGGPTTTGMYPNWMKSLLEFCNNNSLPIDFLSYHRYTRDVNVFSDDWQQIQKILDNYPQYKDTEIVVTEWGSDAGNSPDHDSAFDAIHTIASVRQFIDRVNLAFTFEVKDGPGEAEYWGRWGIITHDKYGLHLKPRYYALSFLNNLKGQRLKIDGEGSWVTALGVKNQDVMKFIIVNYDADRTHKEDLIPFVINNVPSANYSLKKTYMFGSTKTEIVDGRSQAINTTFSMPAQSALLLEFTKLAPEYTYSLGYFGGFGNRGLTLQSNTLPYKINRDVLTFPKEGGMEFFLKNLWDENSKDFTLLSVQLDGGRELSLRKESNNFGNKLVWGIYQGQNKIISTETSISDWVKGQWHHLAMNWGANSLSLFVDGVKVNEAPSGVKIGLSGDLNFNNFGGVIDELRIVSQPYKSVVTPNNPYVLNQNTLLLRHFDGNVD